jgi:glucokinase
MILAGDLGGTKTLLALFETQDAITAGAAVFKQRYASDGYVSFDIVLARFLNDARAALGAAPRIEGTGLGVAGPVFDRRVKLTNLPWEIDARRLEQDFRVGQVRLLNDFAAMARGLGALEPDDLVTLQAGEPIRGAPRLALGAGTGLGVAYEHADRVVAGEGGHMAFAPNDATQAALWEWLRPRFGRVEIEHVVSGPGLARIFEFLGQREKCGSARAAKLLHSPAPTPAIVAAALRDNDPLAEAAVRLFLACYGAVAGDFALALTARGGVYIAGGVAPHLASRLKPYFVDAFNDKTAFSAMVQACPLHLVVNVEVGLLGAAVAARAAAA